MRSDAGDGAATVLLVDAPEQTDIYTPALRREGFRVVALASGTQALECARRLRPSIIVSERRLPPDITGDELYRRLQQDPKTARIPFLFLSASVFAGRPADASVAPLAFKPLLPDQLVSLLRSMGVVAR